MNMPRFTAEQALRHHHGRYVLHWTGEAAGRADAIYPQLRPRAAGWICDFIWGCCEGGSFECCWYWIFNCTGEGTVAVNTFGVQAR
jgi:hypothetical protein